jgi:transposase
MNEETEAIKVLKYTAENISAMTGMKWITRVPLSIKEAQSKILYFLHQMYSSKTPKESKQLPRSWEYACS